MRENSQPNVGEGEVPSNIHHFFPPEENEARNKAEDFLQSLCREYRTAANVIYSADDLLSIYTTCRAKMEMLPYVQERVSEPFLFLMQERMRKLKETDSGLQSIIGFIYLCLSTALEGFLDDEIVSQEVQEKIYKICDKYNKEHDTFISYERIVRLYHRFQLDVLDDSNVKSEMHELPEDFISFFIHEYNSSAINSFAELATISNVVGLLTSLKSGKIY